MTTTHAAQARAHAQRAVEHLERLIAGDGITCADLVIFGAQLRDALRARDAAARALGEGTRGGIVAVLDEETTVYSIGTP